MRKFWILLAIGAGVGGGNWKACTKVGRGSKPKACRIFLLLRKKWQTSTLVKTCHWSKRAEGIGGPLCPTEWLFHILTYSEFRRSHASELIWNPCLPNAMLYKRVSMLFVIGADLYNNFKQKCYSLCTPKYLSHLF